MLSLEKGTFFKSYNPFIVVRCKASKMSCKIRASRYEKRYRTLQYYPIGYLKYAHSAAF